MAISQTKMLTGCIAVMCLMACDSGNSFVGEWAAIANPGLRCEIRGDGGNFEVLWHNDYGAPSPMSYKLTNGVLQRDGVPTMQFDKGSGHILLGGDVEMQRIR